MRTINRLAGLKARKTVAAEQPICRTYIVVIDGEIVHQTNELMVAIGYRMGAKRGSVFSRVLDEYTER